MFILPLNLDNLICCKPEAGDYSIMVTLVNAELNITVCIVLESQTKSTCQKGNYIHQNGKLVYCSHGKMESI